MKIENSFLRKCSGGMVLSQPRKTNYKFEKENLKLAHSPKTMLGCTECNVFLIDGEVYFEPRTGKGLGKGSFFFFLLKDKWHKMKATLCMAVTYAFVFRKCFFLGRLSDTQIHRFLKWKDFEDYDHVVLASTYFGDLVEDVEFGGIVEAPKIDFDNCYHDDDRNVFDTRFNADEENVYQEFKKHIDIALKGPCNKKNKTWKCPTAISDFNHDNDFLPEESVEQVFASRKFVLPIVGQLPKINSRKSNGKMRTIVSMSRTLYAYQYSVYGVINKYDTDVRVIKDLNGVFSRNHYYDISNADEHLLKYVYRYAEYREHVDILCPYIFDHKRKKFVRVNKFASGMLVTKLFTECFVLALLDHYNYEALVQGDGFMGNEIFNLERVKKDLGITIRKEDNFNGFRFICGIHHVSPNIQVNGWYWQYVRARSKLDQRRYVMNGRINGLRRRYLLEYIYIYYLNADIEFSKENYYKNRKACDVFTEIQEDIELRKIINKCRENHNSNVIEDYPILSYHVLSKRGVPRFYYRIEA